MLSYRQFRESDVPGILELWKQETNWGELSEQEWYDWFIDTPNGRSHVVVAVDDDDDVVGQVMVVPTEVVVDGQVARAGRLLAPVIRRNLRKIQLRRTDHPVIGLFQALTDPAIAGTYDLTYSFPDRAWIPIVRWLAKAGFPVFMEAAFPCVKLSLESPVEAATEKSESLRAKVVDTFDDRFVDLWQSAQCAYGFKCAAVRLPDQLKFHARQFLTIEVCREGQSSSLLGYVAIKRGTNLLVDILTVTPDSMEEVLAAAIGWLLNEREKSTDGAMNHLSAMETVQLGPALRSLGFLPQAYTYAFIVKSLSPILADSTIAPDRWYLMPGD